MRFLFAVCLTLACLSYPVHARTTFVPQTLPATIAVCFTPAQTCDAGIVAALAPGAATKSIRIQGYGYTSPVILRAVVEAKARGLDVEVILDKSNQRKPYTGATFMVNAHVPTWIDNHPAIAHNKIIIIDEHLVIGGSYNYTRSAETRNAENVTYIDSPAVAALFRQNWESRKAVSKVYQAAEAGPTETVAE